MSANSKVASPTVATAFLRACPIREGDDYLDPVVAIRGPWIGTPSVPSYSGSPTVLDLERRVRAIPTMVRGFMRHGYMYNGGFEKNYSSLKVGTTTYQGSNGEVRPLPEWPAKVDGIRVGYMEKSGKKFTPCACSMTTTTSCSRIRSTSTRCGT